eukprot:gene12493-biopygen7941
MVSRECRTTKGSHCTITVSPTRPPYDPGTPSQSPVTLLFLHLSAGGGDTKGGQEVSLRHGHFTPGPDLSAYLYSWPLLEVPVYPTPNHVPSTRNHCPHAIVYVLLSHRGVWSPRRPKCTSARVKCLNPGHRTPGTPAHPGAWRAAPTLPRRTQHLPEMAKEIGWTGTSTLGQGLASLH